MRKKAKDVLRQLDPCREIRDAEHQVAKADALTARSALDRAAEELAVARRNQEDLQRRYQLSLIGPTISVQDLRLWRSSFTQVFLDVASADRQVATQEENVDGLRQALARSDGSLKLIERAIRAAERGLARERDEAALQEVEEKSRKRGLPHG